MVTRQSVGPDRATDTELVVDEDFTEEEPTKEEILKGIRIGIRQALAGETRPVQDVIDEVRRELDENADAS